MSNLRVGYFHCIRPALYSQWSRYIAHSSGASKGPRVELRGREANMVSTVTTNLAEAPLITADLHLDAFRECNAGDAIFASNCKQRQRGLLNQVNKQAAVGEARGTR